MAPRLLHRAAHVKSKLTTGVFGQHRARFLSESGSTFTAEVGCYGVSV
jgi:hypothetical protein